MHTINEHSDQVEKLKLFFRFYFITLNGNFADELCELINRNGKLCWNKSFNRFICVAQVSGYKIDSCNDQCLERFAESAPAILLDIEVDM